MLSNNWQKEAKEKQKLFKRSLEKGNKNKMLRMLPSLHEEAFKKIDCLACANCCKNYSPTFKQPDIKRISRYLGMKESDFVTTYLRVDEDEDYVLKSSPCPFLGTDNRCSIYDSRPSDCSRYPYTDEDVLLKRIPLTLKNTMVCPAAFYVLDKLSSSL